MICLRGKSVAGLSESDRHLTTALVLGVLRWQIDLDLRIQTAAETSERQAGCGGADRAAARCISAAAYGPDSGTCGDRRKRGAGEAGGTPVCFGHGECGASQSCGVALEGSRRSAGRGRLAARISRVDGCAVDDDLRRGSGSCDLQARAEPAEGYSARRQRGNAGRTRVGGNRAGGGANSHTCIRCGLRRYHGELSIS